MDETRVYGLKRCDTCVKARKWLVVGLDGEIDRVRGEYPEFFQVAKPKPKARPTAADRKPVEEKPKSAAERHAQRVLGRTA